MSASYDAIVIGGGHNGLVNAAYLAKAGLRTLLLEQRDVVGGAAITEDFEGARSTTFSYALSHLRPEIVEELNLVEHGLMVLQMVSTFQPGRNGEYLLLGPDADANHHEIARISPADAEAARLLDHRIQRLANALKPWFDRVPPNIRSGAPEDAAALAELEAYLADLDPEVRTLLDQFRSCSAAEILDSWFEHDLVKALYASSGIIGSLCGPRSKESGIVWLFHKMGSWDGNLGEWGFHKDGNGGFTQVLARALEAFGGEIRTGARVAEVLHDGTRTRGVRLDSGEEIAAGTVVSALDPRATFTRLIDPDVLPDDLVEHVRAMKFQGSASKVNFVLNDLPTFPGLGNSPELFRGFINVGPSIDYLEEAFAEALEGRFSRRPFIDACIQSTIDPDMAPPGKHVMSCFVMYTPFHLAEGSWDERADALGDTVEETLEEFFPGFRSLVERRKVVTPLHIERTVGLAEGNIFAGELFESQLFTHRPAPGWNQYATPIEGYWQCGSGTHPGGCVSGGPGRLAAQRILGDLVAPIP